MTDDTKRTGPKAAPPSGTNPQPPPTREEVEKVEERLAGTRDRLTWLKSRSREVLSGLASLRAEGREGSPEAEALRSERATLLLEQEELDQALPLLEAKVEDMRWTGLRGQAEARLKAIGLSIKGHVAEHENRIRRLQKAVRLVQTRMARLNDGKKATEDLEAEARALASRFDLPLPALPTLEAPAKNRWVREEFGKLEAVGLYKGRSPIVRGFPKSAPGARILEEAGPTEAEKARQEENDRKEAERLAVERSLLRPVRGRVEQLERLGKIEQSRF